MEANRTEIEDRVRELLTVLDADIRHLRESIQRVDELRRLVVKRDHDGLTLLLDAVHAESGDYVDNELKRKSIRQALASIMGCEVQDVTLSAVEEICSASARTQLSQRKIELKALVRRLKYEHVRTTSLLSDCARFNGELLQGIIKAGTAGATTYASNGTLRRHGDAAVVTMQL